MKKDISFLPVEGISIAIARIKNELNQFIWNVYILNRNNQVIHDVVIRSKGYGMVNGENKLTSTLRHHIKGLDPQTNVLVEPIDPSVFPLYNEYWVSYFINNQVFDKKFIFVPDSIIEENLIFIPQLELEGILHN
jgi:hypothetical protein